MAQSDISLESEPEITDAIRRLGLATGAPTTAGRERARAVTLAAVREQRTRSAGRAPTSWMSRRRYVGFAMAAAAALTVMVAIQPSFVVQPVQAALGLSGGSASIKAEGRLEAVASGDALASGKAKSEQRTDRTRFAVEVEDVASPPGDYAVALLRDGTPVAGSQGLIIHIDSFGFGDLDLDSRNGATVPVAQATDIVEVAAADGTVILRGTLATK